MKKQLLLLALIAFFNWKAMAQCIPAIPSNAVVVNATTTINGGFDPIWVCSNDTLHSDGGFHNTFLETGAVMTTSGGIDTIYVKSGASFFMNGGIHVIFYENLSDLNIAGGIPTEVSCTSLAFNYTNAPTNGCALSLASGFHASDSTICKGTCVDFSNLSSNATSWQWSFPGGNPSASTDQNPQSICYNTPGSYDVTLIASNANGSDTLTLSNYIVVSPSLSAPVITQSNDTLFSSLGYATYQWYFESTLINGATNYFYVASQSGLYILAVTGDNGCGSTSTISYIATGINESGYASALLSVFPNPSCGIVTLQVNSAFAATFDISIVDLLGRNIFEQTFTLHDGVNELKFDVSTQPPGVYFVRYDFNENHYSKKLVVVH